MTRACLIIGAAMLSASCQRAVSHAGRSSDESEKSRRPIVSEIGIARGGGYCFRCPAYEAIFAGDGRVRYDGNPFVQRPGVHHGHVPTYEFVWLARFILDSGYLQLPDRFEVPETDVGGVTTYVIVDGKRKGVWNQSDSGPPLVWAIEQLIDKLLLDTQWEDGAASRPADAAASRASLQDEGKTAVPKSAHNG